MLALMLQNMNPNIYIPLIILLGMILSVSLKKLTILASITGGALALLIYFGTDYKGLLFLSAFFVLGTMATSWKHKQKELLPPAESGSMKRTVGQVLANGGVAGILGFIAFLFPQMEPVLLALIAAAFASATSDTLSSELGNLYGRRFYNIIGFKPDVKGQNGVISFEGTLCGLAGATIIAFIHYVVSNNGVYFFWIILAGTIGNFSDSILGATLERRKLLTNNAVNFINTVIAAIAMLIFIS